MSDDEQCDESINFVTRAFLVVKSIFFRGNNSMNFSLVAFIHITSDDIEMFLELKMSHDFK